MVVIFYTVYKMITIVTIELHKFRRGK